ncbi:hypothetical protein [Deinococcus multiflagellatus]|uniref:Uncharacterized protein n=1 Tax=Deinococcus multiflagellatus TaxID=1656887 RepID=A0ABW1ZMV0_9DEIO
MDEELKPHFESLPFRQQQRLKETLRYALTWFDDDALVEAYDSAYLPLERPQGNIREFYVRLWDGMFGPEDFSPVAQERYIERFGPSESMWD